MSRVGGEVFSLTRSFSSRPLSNATLPTIQAAVGHIPQKLKTNGIEPNRRARLEVSEYSNADHRIADVALYKSRDTSNEDDSV